MPLHHFFPHAGTLAIILSSALAGAAAYTVMRRDRVEGAGGLASNLRAVFSRGVDAVGAARTTAVSRTGNSSFDDYRAETLKKLEVEAAEFRAYLNGLRSANDRAEFEAFLKGRKGGA